MANRLASVAPIRGVTKPASQTDTGNTDLMVALHRDRLRYCPEAGQWLTWDGERWKPATSDGPAFGAARGSIDAITADDQNARHIIKSLSRSSLASMVALAQRHPDMTVELSELDSRPYDLNTPSGVVSLKTGGCHAHSPDLFHTKLTGVGYDPKMPTPLWDGFLQTTFGGDTDLIGYVQRLAGISAIGEVREHILPFLFGGGSNGKTVFSEVLTEVLGEYAITAPANFLLAGRDKHETEIARLRGVRLVVCSEVNADSKFDEAKVKMLTGGDTLSARFMHQNFFDFAPSHTLVLHGNHQPTVSAGGTSFWRRLRLVPFDHRVADGDRTEGLSGILIESEGPGILAWIATGARLALAGPLVTPPAVTAATGEYAAEEDALGRFLRECVNTGGDPATGAQPARLLNSYCAWAQATGEPTSFNSISFGRALSAKGHRAKGGSHGGDRFHPGLSVKPEWVPSWVRKP